MEKPNTSNCYSAEIRSRAMQMVLEHGVDHASQWVAIGSIAAEIGCTAENAARLGSTGGAGPGTPCRLDRRLLADVESAHADAAPLALARCPVRYVAAASDQAIKLAVRIEVMKTQVRLHLRTRRTR
jgi:hypothetical protein